MTIRVTRAGVICKSDLTPDQVLTRDTNFADFNSGIRAKAAVLASHHPRLGIARNGHSKNVN